MIVGSNERRYAWMDEGFNTYQNAFSNERRAPGSNVFAAVRRELAAGGRRRDAGAAHDAARSHRRRRRSARSAYRKAGRGAPRAPRRCHRARRDGSRDARVRASMGIQASHARRFLSHDRERVGRGSLVVLERVLLRHRRARHRASTACRCDRRGARASPKFTSTGDEHPVPGDDAAQAQRRLDPGREAPGRDLDSQRSLHSDDARAVGRSSASASGPT